MNKTISKEIMKRTRVRNQFLKNRTDENKLGPQKKELLCLTIKKKNHSIAVTLMKKMLLIKRRSGKQLNLFFIGLFSETI